MSIATDNRVSKELGKYVYISMHKKYENDCKIMATKGRYASDSSGRTIREHLFHITVTYRHSHSIYRDDMTFSPERLDSHLSYINRSFEKLHKAFSLEMVSGNIYRQRYLQPYCIMAIDAETTQHSRYFHTDLAGNFTHHHGVMLIHPKQLEEFIHFNAKENWRRIANQNNNIAEIHVQPVTSFNRRFLSYNNKLAAQLITRPELSASFLISMPHTTGLQLDRLWGVNSTSLGAIQ